MLRNILSVLLLSILVLAGCRRPESDIGQEAVGQDIDTSAGMVDYLKRQNLPTLKDVQQWDNKYGPGLKITTAHYEIFTTLLEPLMLGQLPGFVESAYRGFNNQLPSPAETTAKFTVYLFGERKQWEDFTKTFAGHQAAMYTKIKAGAYYLNGSCVAYNIGRQRTFSVLGHEGWHQFNSRLFEYRLPSWLDEGIAMQFEASRYENGLFYFDPDKNLYRLGDLKITLAHGRMMPLRTLVAINPGQVLMTADDYSVAAFYSQSYALVRFLREEDYGRRLSNFHKMLLDGLNGRWQISDSNKKIAVDRNIPLTIPWNEQVGPQLFEQYISGDFEKIEKEYQLFCKKIVYHVRFE